jgi:urea transport system substrate-binding protein
LAPGVPPPRLLPDPAAAWPPQVGNYEVLAEVGRGGMGVVFRAEDTHLRRAVALKVILLEFVANPVARERFLREARACAAIKKDYVVTIYQVGQDGGLPYLAMEFLQGQSLEDRLSAGPPLALTEIPRIGREATDGLAAAHAHGLIHRDIKPANIWLEAPTRRVKLLDFGLARGVGRGSGLTDTGQIAGTPEYMSPEQAHGGELDARSDLFSLGAVLYTVCCGQKPFAGDSILAVLTAVTASTPRGVRDLNADVPPALAALVERLLEKDPAKRPASARAVRDELAAIEAALPTQAGQPSQPQAPAASAVPPRPTARRPLGRIGHAGLGAGAALLGCLALAAAWSFFRPARDAVPQAVVPSGPLVRIGVLHSQTGTMAISEQPVIDSILLAVEEINRHGGVLGRPVEAVLADGQSDEVVFAHQAEKLIREDQDCTLFGCWTSASRKAVVPVVERHHHLLFYSVQYEGVEQSPNVVYLGRVPNQQILPALRWLVGFEGKKRWFLVRSEYVFPAVANAVIRDEARSRGCEVVGEEYLPLGSTDVGRLVGQITQTQPDLIVNTINGDSNVAFFRALRRAGVSSKDYPTLSFSLSEEELSKVGPRDTAGDYVAASYFHSLDTPQNRELLGRFGQRYGSGRVVSNPMETAYVAVHLWAQAIQTAGRYEAGAIREAVRGRTFDAPQGLMRIDPATLHTIHTARVGRVEEGGRLAEVYLSPRPIAPEPYPASRGREAWEGLLERLRGRWGGRWSSPVP